MEFGLVSIRMLTRLRLQELTGAGRRCVCWRGREGGGAGGSRGAGPRNMEWGRDAATTGRGREGERSGKLVDGGRVGGCVDGCPEQRRMSRWVGGLKKACSVE